MKKAIAIFFLLFFCLSQTANYVIYSINKWHIKNEVREEILAGVPDRYLERIEYNIDIEWEEEGKEFSLKDEFYDVVRIKEINGKKILYCLNDKNEEQLVKNFEKSIKSSTDNERGKNNKHYFKFHLVDQHIINLISAILSGCLNLPEFFNYEAALTSICRQIIIPPPWYIVS